MIKLGEGLPSPLFDRLVGYCRSRVFGQKCFDGLLIVHADQFALLPLIVTLCEQDQAGNRLDPRKDSVPYSGYLSMRLLCPTEA